MIEERGKYDTECEFMRDELQAEFVLLLVCNGKSGTGFSVVTTDQEYIDKVPDLLENMARDMRAASKAQKN
jgi:hypothetical protein